MTIAIGYVTIGLSLFVYLLCNRNWRKTNMVAWYDYVLAPIFLAVGWPVYCFRYLANG